MKFCLIDYRLSDFLLQSNGCVVFCKSSTEDIYSKNDHLEFDDDAEVSDDAGVELQEHEQGKGGRRCHVD